MHYLHQRIDNYEPTAIAPLSVLSSEGKVIALCSIARLKLSVIS